MRAESLLMKVRRQELLLYSTPKGQLPLGSTLPAVTCCHMSHLGTLHPRKDHQSGQMFAVLGARLPRWTYRVTFLAFVLLPFL